MENFEIERKFLVAGDFKSSAVSSSRIRQGYLCSDGKRTVRIRTRDDKAFITVKGRPRPGELGRFEWEKQIDFEPALQMLDLCEPGIIDKTRYIVPGPDGREWEVDEFYGENDGLVVAELELTSEDEVFVRPEWLGTEVTGDHRYANSALGRHPYTKWSTPQ